MLSNSVLCCGVVQYATAHCSTAYRSTRQQLDSILHYSTAHYSTSYCTTPQHTALLHIILHYFTQHSTPRRTTPQCTTAQCCKSRRSTVPHSALRNTAEPAAEYERIQSHTASSSDQHRSTNLQNQHSRVSCTGEQYDCWHALSGFMSRCTTPFKWHQSIAFRS